MKQRRATWIAALPFAFSCAGNMSVEDELHADVEPRQASIISLVDPGYSTLPTYRQDINRDGRVDVCRFVGDAPDIFLSCKYDSPDGSGEEYAYNSIAGIDRGYPNLASCLLDVNADGWRDFCRFVGDAPDVFVACDLGREDGFDPDQYGFRTPTGLDLGYPDLLSYFGFFELPGPMVYCRSVGPRATATHCCTVLRSWDDDARPYGEEQYELCDLAGSGATPPPAKPTPRPVPEPSIPRHQRVQATCECRLSSDVELRTEKIFCLSRTEESLIQATIAGMCAQACAIQSNNNWQTEEDNGFWSTATLLDGDCTQTGADIGFQ